MKKSNLIIIILGIIIVILGILCTFFYLESEHNEKLYEDLKFNNSFSQDENENFDVNNFPDKIEDEDLISGGKALQIVLDSLNIKESDIYDLSNELEYKYDAYVYEIDFNYKNYEYDYYVNAKTGKIIKAFRERD